MVIIWSMDESTGGSWEHKVQRVVYTLGGGCVCLLWNGVGCGG